MNLHSVRDCLALQNIGGDLMAFEIAGIAAKAVETGKKVVEVAKKTEKVVSTVEKPIKAVEKVTAEKDGNWGADIVKSGAQKGVGEIKSGLANKLKDYLGKDDVASAAFETNADIEKQADVKEKQEGVEPHEDKNSLKDRLNKYLDSADSQPNIGENVQDDNITAEKENGSNDIKNDNLNHDNENNSETSEEVKDNSNSALDKEASNSQNDATNEENTIEYNKDKKVFSCLDDMKEALGENYKEIKASKPMNSPNVAKWFDKGGKIEITEQSGKRVWTYINPEGIAVKYVDGYPIFPPETKHPVIGDLSIGEFTGDRNEDKKLYLEILEEEYGLTEIPEGYALHHDSENGTMQLVKEEYHKEFTHAGGHSKYKECAEC